MKGKLPHRGKAEASLKKVDFDAVPTHLRILLTAERLFAQFGISAVSMRDISAAAGQKNTAAVQYHFGDRDNLLRQIVVYRTGLMQTLVDRIQLLSREGTKVSAEYLVDDYVKFLATNIADGNNFIPFLSKFLTETGGTDALRSAIPVDTVTFLEATVNGSMGSLSAEIIQNRWHILMSNAVHSLAGYQTMRTNGSLTAPLGVLIDDLIAFLIGGLQTRYKAKRKSKKSGKSIVDGGSNATGEWLHTRPSGGH